jgi:hypothetical protein
MVTRPPSSAARKAAASLRQEEVTQQVVQMVNHWSAFPKSIICVCQCLVAKSILRQSSKIH